MDIHRVAVVGAGAMGSGIAAALSLAGIPVLLKDIDLDLATQGVTRAHALLKKGVEKKKISREAVEHAMERLTPVDSYDWFGQVDLAIEAAAEEIEVKHKIFEELDASLPKGAILATNTSSISVSWIASATRRPGRVVGMHFFNPAHIMKLVEVVSGLNTTHSTVDEVVAFCKRVGKRTVRVRECASFLVNRLLARYGNEALYVLSDHLATADEIDRAAMEYGVPMGPITLRDFTGIDIGLNIARINYAEYGPRFEPPSILARLHAKGYLGRKVGKGFYLYDPETGKQLGVNPDLAEMLRGSPRAHGEFDPRRLFLAMINEAFLALGEQVVDATELDPAMQSGLGMRMGPLKIAEEMGLRKCLDLIEALFDEEGERFRPAPLLRRMVWAGRTRVVV